MKPPDPSYARNGSNAKLVWDYSVDKQGELAGVIFSVLYKSAYKKILVKQNGIVVNPSETPFAYKGRVTMEGNASLVIKNVTPQDNTKFKCEIVPVSGQTIEDTVQLIVTGMYC